MAGVTESVNLGSWLTRRTVDQLAEIIERRPDSYWGAPLRGLSDLASRLAQPPSVIAAVSALPLPAVEVIQALSALGPRPTVGSAADLLDRGNRDPDAHLSAVLAALALLEASALAWRTEPVAEPAAIGSQVIAVNPALRLVVEQPLGLGRTVAAHLSHTPVEHLRGMLRSLGLRVAAGRDDAAELLEEFLTDRQRVQDLLRTAPASTRRRMAQLVGGDDEAVHDPADREGENWARARGLLFGGHYYPAEVPVEVELALRAGEISVRFDPDPPPLDTAPADRAAITAGAAAAAAEFTETVAAVVDSMARSPVPELKIGGVGNREVARLAKSLGLTDGTIRFALELIRALGLLTGVGTGVGVGEPAARWRSGEPTARFADLAVAWWGLPITPTITRDADGKAITAIGRRSVDGSALDLRRTVMRTIGALPSGHGLTDTGSLAAHLNWHQPGRIDEFDPSITAIWTEAHDVGVLVGGAVTPIGAALLAGSPEQLLEVAGQLLAPATTAGRFGSDLTVMVAGSPTAAVTGLLDSCADRESRGAAIVWRFSPGSIRRAMDEGATAEELIAGLTAIADAELPQTLTYLIGDVARRHGTLVVHPALSCLRSDDQSLLIEVAAHRSLRSLRPHPLAPTVIAFQAEPSVVLRTLRAAGYFPVAAGADGVIVLDRRSGSAPGDPDDSSSPAPMVEQLRDLGPVGSGAPGGDPDAAAAVRDLAAALLSTGAVGAGVSRNRAQTPTDEMIEVYGVQLDEVERRQLAFAIDHQVPVSITYQAASGGTTTRTISDIELINGTMYAWCHLRDDERVFSVDRVQAVVPVHA